MSNSATSDTLLIKEIPISQNNIPNLSSHFSNFGKVKLVSTGYNGDPRAALVTFASPEEARKAFISPTPLFNDRMVQVHMHTANRFAQYSTANKQGWPCQHCSSVLASKQNLDKHIACKHAGVTCTVCNSRFETLNEYGKHFNAMHSEMSFNSSSGAKMQTQSQLQPPSQSTQNVFQSNETKPSTTEAIKKIRAKYNSLKKKLKKRDKANYKLVKFHTKSRNQLNATIKGKWIFSVYLFSKWRTLLSLGCQ